MRPRDPKSKKLTARQKARNAKKPATPAEVTEEAENEGAAEPKTRKLKEKNKFSERYKGKLIKSVKTPWSATKPLTTKRKFPARHKDRSRAYNGEKTVHYWTANDFDRDEFL